MKLEQIKEKYTTDDELLKQYLKLSKQFGETPTRCCALSMISVTDRTIQDELETFLELKRYFSEFGKFQHGTLNGGQRTILANTLSKNEVHAENLLVNLGFQQMASIQRVTCFKPDQVIHLWIYSW